MIKRTKSCEICGAKYTTNKFHQKYCGQACREARNRDRRPKPKSTCEKRIDNIPDNSFFRWIGRYVVESGTVEILTGVDLVELEKLYRARYRANGWGTLEHLCNPGKDKFNLCHISPVKGEGTIGLLHHENLFIGGSFHNRKFSNNQFESAGLFLEKSKLDKKWLVDESTKRKVVFRKIKRFLGQKLVEYAKQYPIQKTKHLLTAKKIYNTKKSGYSLAKLESMAPAELRYVEAGITGNSAYQVTQMEPMRKLQMYLYECERLANFNPSCLILIPYLRLACLYLAQTVEKYDVLEAHRQKLHELIPPQAVACLPQLEIWTSDDQRKFRDWISMLAFEVLQGKEIDELSVKETFNGFVVVFEDLPHRDLDATNEPHVVEIANQLKVDLVSTGLCAHVVCKSVTRQARTIGGTRLSAIHEANTFDRKEVKICTNQPSIIPLREASRTTSKRSRFEDYLIAMDVSLQQLQILYRIAS